MKRCVSALLLRRVRPLAEAQESFKRRFTNAESRC